MIKTAAIDYSTLRSCLQKGISFAAYSLPGETNFSLIVQKNKAVGIENFSSLDQGFIIHPFDANSSHPILLIKNDFFLREGNSNKNLLEFLQSREDYSLADSSTILEQSKADYLNSFQEFKKAIDQGKFQKLVLSRIKNLKIDQAFDIVKLFEKLNEIHKYSFNHLSFTPQSGIWLGASPEILLCLNTEQAITMALAGTQKKSSSSAYMWEGKEIEEQKFVVDYIQDILKEQLPQSEIKIKNETVEAGEMLHLKTNFVFPSKELNNIAELINQLHPTPAVCGLPKERAKQFITQNEIHDRTYYAGYLGPININQESHLFVNLRCLKMENKSLLLFLGGGLTRDSIAEKEWNETELKATTLESLL